MILGTLRAVLGALYTHVAGFFGTGEVVARDATIDRLYAVDAAIRGRYRPAVHVCRRIDADVMVHRDVATGVGIRRAVVMELER